MSVMRRYAFYGSQSAESKFVECKYIPLPVPLNKSNIVQNTFLCSKSYNKIFRFQIHIKNLTQCIKPLYLFQYCRNLFYMSFLAQPNAIESHKKFSKLLQHHQCNSHITNQCKQIPETIQCKKFQSPAMFSLASINLN